MKLGVVLLISSFVFVSCVGGQYSKRTASYFRDVPSEYLDRTNALQRSDDEIRAAIESSFLYDMDMGPNRPDVTVQNQIVTLTGRVQDEKSKYAAESNARLPGEVKSVINRIEVIPNIDLQDAALERAVKLALALNSSLIGSRVEVRVKKRIVHLTGYVDSMRKKRLAEDIAASSTGPLVLQSELQVKKRS